MANAEYQKAWRDKNKEKMAAYRKKWRMKNKDKLTAYDRQWRKKNRKRIVEYYRKYRREHPEKIRRWRNENGEYIKRYQRNHYASVKRWRERNREKLHAHTALKRAIKRGEMVRPNSCVQCGKVCKPDAHHPNYKKPLKVLWLCRACHWKAHGRGQ